MVTYNVSSHCVAFFHFNLKSLGTVFLHMFWRVGPQSKLNHFCIIQYVNKCQFYVTNDKNLPCGTSMMDHPETCCKPLETGHGVFWQVSEFFISIFYFFFQIKN